MQTLVECVPNFSEGRDARIVGAIAAAAAGVKGVWLLDRHLDADHHRSVLTLVGTLEGIGEAALAAIGEAARLIDLREHRGAHPRIGSTDVVPFVPISGVSMEDCVRISEWVAEQAWLRFGIPTYLYEAAARRPERRHLENIRIGQFEGLREEIPTNPKRLPDFGTALHPTAGATVVGARKFLIAFNVNLDSPDVAVAKEIARTIRTSSGGLPSVKAMGVMLKARNLAQVSMNLTDFETTPVHAAFLAVKDAAARQGVGVVGSEIVGLIPRVALERAAMGFLHAEGFQPDMIFENRLASVLPGQAPVGGLKTLAEGFVAAVAEPVPTPGGGSVASLAGSLAAALGEMVCGVTLKRDSFHEHFPRLEEARGKLNGMREKLLDRIDRDAESYQDFLRARRLPHATPAEEGARTIAMDSAGKLTVSVPQETAELVNQVVHILNSLKGITIPQADSDLSVALMMAEAGLQGSLENVRTNLASIADKDWVARARQALAALERAKSGV